ncbi:MAG: GIY-YIG nuclease family protein [Planctomycetota bacterium]
MYYLYILQSEKDKRTYVGFSQNITLRLKQHNAGKVNATKNRCPFQIIYSEKLPTAAEAKQREKYWKTGAGRRKLMKLLSGFPPPK